MIEEKISKTQARMLEVLSDGRDHTREELHACLDDQLSALSAIQFHIYCLRKVLKPIGQDIVCFNRRGIFYRQVRNMAHPDDE